MALWKQALAKLRGSADKVPAAEANVDVAEAVVEEAAAAEENSEEPEAGVGTDALARELRVGIEVSIGDLESCDAGWRYRGHPVMVFATEAPELNDPKRRREFFARAHLYPCCGALQSDRRSAWVASSDLGTINDSHGQGPFVYCKTCLEAVAGRGASPAAFDFLSHVRNHGDSYFAKKAQYWQAGTDSQPLQAPAAEAKGSCPKCGCTAEEPHWQLSTGDAQQLSLPEGICLLCAEREVDGCLYFGEAELLAAARVRYSDLLKKAAKAPAPSWKLAEAMLPLGWQPLLRRLQRMLPAPELFHTYDESMPPAILAWPDRARGVIEHGGGAEGQGAAGWSFWTRAQIEAELGFKLR